LNGIDIFDFAQINGRIFAGTSQGIYISNDTGQTWQKKNSGIKYPYVNSLLANRSNFVFAATSGGGVFRSTDNGETWLELNSGLSDSLIKTLTIDNNDYIYAGTSKSIYRSRVLASPVAEYALPRYEKGISVYPNPFSYSATVSLNIQNPVQVKIKIINSTGQEVKSIENRYLDIGEHRYTLIADGLPSGLYFIIAENGMNCSSEIIVLAR
jgi:ligand-binding sensor domain-containing protein